MCGPMRPRVVVAVCLGLACLSLGAGGDQGEGELPKQPPRNRFLAQSNYALGHGNSAQQDSALVDGPTGPTDKLEDNKLEYAPIGPAHFGIAISSEYDDGRRVIWSNGGDRIAKLDHDTLEVLATYELPGKKVWTEAEADEAIEKLETLPDAERTGFAVELASSVLLDLSGVYALLDRDGNFYVGGPEGITVYGDEVEGDPDSGIAVRATWAKPPEVTGAFIGMNMTYDGRLVLVTEHGYVIALKRDLSEYQVVQLLHSENAREYSEAMAATGQVGRGWVRNGYAIDKDGGIYIASNDHLHKVVWTGDRLSVDEADDAWSEPYRNGRGIGTGSTPVLMGFGEEDRFVVITDGDDLMNVTLYWRDEIPADWEPLDGAPSPRVAGFLPADMGDAARTKIQTEQAVVVAGYGALVVNNEPASVPPNFMGRAVLLLSSYLGADPRYTPHGVQKFEWNAQERRFEEDWVNQKVTSPNAVPYISVGADTAYTVGARDGKWTLEGLDWDTGKSTFHFVVGGERYNSLFSGIHLDQDGRIIYGTMWGKVRLEP